MRKLSPFSKASPNRKPWIKPVYAGFIHGFLFGDAFEKGLSFRMGQTHVQHYMPLLLDEITRGRLDPGAIISHRLALEQAEVGYRIFDSKADDCRKVVLIPGLKD